MDKYEVYVHRWGFCSDSNDKYVGTIEELKKEGLPIGNKKPRTLNGLKKILDEYSRKVATTYTGVEYEVYQHYGN